MFARHTISLHVFSRKLWKWYSFVLVLHQKWDEMAPRTHLWSQRRRSPLTHQIIGRESTFTLLFMGWNVTGDVLDAGKIALVSNASSILLTLSFRSALYPWPCYSLICDIECCPDISIPVLNLSANKYHLTLSIFKLRRRPSYLVCQSVPVPLLFPTPYFSLRAFASTPPTPIALSQVFPHLIQD